MVTWSSQSLEAEGEESNLGFLFRPVFLQKYLGYSEHRCAGMARIPDVLFGPKKKGRQKVRPGEQGLKDRTPHLLRKPNRPFPLPKGRFPSLCLERKIREEGTSLRS
jgi:hypothetical protein